MFPNLSGKTVLTALIAFVLVTALSYFGHASAVIEWALFLFLSLAFVFIIFRSFELGVLILLGELFMGSFGHLFRVHLAGIEIPIRFVLFAVVLCRWSVLPASPQKFAFFRWHLFRWYCLVLATIAAGIILGMVRGNDPSVLAYDVNGYLFLLIGPALFTALAAAEQRKRGLSVLVAAVLFLAVQAIVLLALFVHARSLLHPLYRWVRDLQLYEVTAISANVYRIFSPTQLYSIIGLCFVFGAALASERRTMRQSIGLTLLACSATLAIVVSQSRSFWLGTAFAAGIAVILAFRIFRKSLFSVSRLIIVLLVVFLLDIAVLSFTANFPYLWARPGARPLAALLSERGKTTTDVASESRFGLIGPMLRSIARHPILGNGFGTTVTFRSSDPRAVATTGGLRTTAAFEWGFLDFALKTGVVGLTAWILLLLRIGQTAWQRLVAQTANHERMIATGALLGIVAVSVIHMFSPYLNHPLGIGFLLFAGALLHFKEQQEPA